MFVFLVIGFLVCVISSYIFIYRSTLIPQPKAEDKRAEISGFVWTFTYVYTILRFDNHYKISVPTGKHDCKLNIYSFGFNAETCRKSILTLSEFLLSEYRIGPILGQFR